MFASGLVAFLKTAAIHLSGCGRPVGFLFLRAFFPRQTQPSMQATHPLSSNGWIPAALSRAFTFCRASSGVRIEATGFFFHVQRRCYNLFRASGQPLKALGACGENTHQCRHKRLQDVIPASRMKKRFESNRSSSRRHLDPFPSVEKAERNASTKDVSMGFLF